jgi:hypothetical protein
VDEVLRGTLPLRFWSWNSRASSFDQAGDGEEGLVEEEEEEEEGDGTEMGTGCSAWNRPQASLWIETP